MWVPKNAGAPRKPEKIVPGNQRTSTLAPITEGVAEGDHKELAMESGQHRMTGQKSGGDVGADKFDRGEEAGTKVGDIQCIIHGRCAI